MVDPTSDLGEGVTEENASRCASCGDPIVQDPNHRVITWVEESTVKTAHFCDERCREQWDGESLPEE